MSIKANFITHILFTDGETPGQLKGPYNIMHKCQKSGQKVSKSAVFIKKVAVFFKENLPGFKINPGSP